MNRSRYGANGGAPRRNRKPFDRRQTFGQTEDISTYCTLNLRTGEVYNCRNLDHACAVGFGNNKKTRSQNWLVIYRDKDCFVCL